MDAADILKALQNPSSLHYNPQSFEIDILNRRSKTASSLRKSDSSAALSGSSSGSSSISSGSSSAVCDPLATSQYVELQPNNAFKGRRLTIDWTEIGRKSALRNMGFRGREKQPLGALTPSTKFIVRPPEEVFLVAAPLLSDWRCLFDSAGLQQDIHTLEMRGAMSFVLEAAMRSVTHKPFEVKTVSKAHAAVFHPRHWSPTDDLAQRLNNLRI